jgi:hypothetical protein
MKIGLLDGKPAFHFRLFIGGGSGHRDHVATTGAEQTARED